MICYARLTNKYLALNCVVSEEEKSSETQYLEFISRLCSQLLTYQDLGGGVQLLLVFRYSHFHSLYLKYFQDKSNENNSTIEQFSIPLHDCMLTILSNLVLANWDSFD